MNPDLSGLLSCTYGTAAFQLEDYQARNRAIVRDGHGRIGSQSEVRLTGYIGAEDNASLSESLSAAFAQLNLDGQDFTIYGIGGAIELQIPASLCLNGGPHVDFEVLGSGPAPGTRAIHIRVWTSQFPTSGVQDAYRVATTRTPDGLRTITRTGEVMGPDTAQYLTGEAFTSFQTTYPTPTWVTRLQYDLGAQQIPGANPSTRYTMSARENFGPLPAADAGDAAVEGTAQKRVERDENLRKTTVYDYDLTVIGDAGALVTRLRPQAPAIVLHESVDIETVAKNHLRASFTILESGGSDALMNWRQSFRISEPSDVWEERTYVGADPILVRAPTRFGRITQSGHATGAQSFKAEPPPAFPYAADLPEVTYGDENVVEKQTQWSYAAFAADGDGNPIPAAPIGTGAAPPADPAKLGRYAADAGNGIFRAAAQLQGGG